MTSYLFLQLLYNRKMNKQRLLLAGFYTFFLCAFYAISLSRYYSFQIFYYDFGVFESIIWQLSQFKIPTIYHAALGDIVFLGDHFNPSLILLAPLFWVVRDGRVLLFEQALATVLSGYMLYRIGRKFNLSLLASFVISLIFLLFAGTQNPLVTDWHPESTAGFFLLLFCYFFMFSKKRLVYWILALIFLGFKESNAISFVSLLAALFFSVPKKRKEIVILGIVSTAWFFLTTKLLIPFFAKRDYFYTPQMPASLNQLAANVSHPQKIRLVFNSFLSFAFLPLLGGHFLIPILGEFAIRFVPTISFFQNYTLGSHYNVYLGIFLSLASIHAFSFVFQRIKKPMLQYTIGMALLIFVLGVDRKITNAPINLIVNAVFWQQLHPRADITQAIQKVPKQGSITASNNLLSYVLLRNEKAYLLTDNVLSKNPDVILFDLSSGQNPNNYYLSSRESLEKLKILLENTPSYQRIEVDNKNIYLYAKKK